MASHTILALTKELISQQKKCSIGIIHYPEASHLTEQWNSLVKIVMAQVKRKYLHNLGFYLKRNGICFVSVTKTQCYYSYCQKKKWVWELSDGDSPYYT